MERRTIAGLRAFALGATLLIVPATSRTYKDYFRGGYEVNKLCEMRINLGYVNNEREKIQKYIGGL